MTLTGTQHRRRHPDTDFICDLQSRFPTESAIDSCLTAKMLSRNAPPSNKLQPIAIRQRLQRFLEKRIDGNITIASFTSLSGGSSKQQFLFRLSHEDNNSPFHLRQFVLSASPAEGTVQSNRVREFEIAQLASRFIPVAMPRWVDPDGEELGAPSIISDFVDGLARPPESLTAASALTGAFPPSIRNTIGTQFTRHLASLADISIDGNLTAFEIPACHSNSSVISAINHWQRVWEEDAIEADSLISLAATWLRKNAPTVEEVSIVHGDYRTGNFLFNPDSLQITAILDWEMARLGDRHDDLAYTLSPLFSFPDERGVPLVCGLMPREEFLEYYSTISGLSIDSKRLEYYAIFNSFRQLVICQGTAARCLVGHSSHQDITVGMVTLAAPTLKKILIHQLKGVL